MNKLNNYIMIKCNYIKSIQVANSYQNNNFINVMDFGFLKYKKQQIMVLMLLIMIKIINKNHNVKLIYMINNINLMIYIFNY